MSQDISKYRENTNNQKPSRPSYYMPVIIGLMLAVGIYIGKSLGSDPVLQKITGQSNPNKIQYVLDQVESRYVEEIDKEELVDEAIRSMLEKLDPHSYYISSDEYQSMAESMQGNFEGIGVEFMIVDDTLTVVNPIQDGPSIKAGILAGDKIVNVDNKPLSGTDISNSDVTKSLKGEKGSEVILDIKRRGEKELLVFTIERDKIPIYSVTASFMVDDNTGYIKVNRFAKNTYQEFKEALEELNDNSMEDLIIDLRGNGGGYMDQASRMIEEFLDDDLLIVYTKGRSGYKDETTTRHRGKYAKNNVVVLINQGSASASEIVSGALQDHDRSITVGRRSFGKGLVQNEIPLGDNSAVRITIARYYTPTGRCIQKPYGDSIDYFHDYSDRMASGELVSADSIIFADSLKYTTPKGRTVYGGGGIMPDVFVPIDTTGVSHYFSRLNYSRIFREFGFNYASKHPEIKNNYETVVDFSKNYKVPNSLLKELTDYAAEADIEKNEDDFQFSKELISIRLKANMAKQYYQDDAYYYVLLSDDKDFKKGMEVLDNFQSFFNLSISQVKNEPSTTIAQ